MAHLGTLSFQAFDNTDLFLVADIFSAQEDATSVDHSDFGVSDLGADSAYYKASSRQKLSVSVDGDTSVLLCTYRSSQGLDLELSIYIEYEMVDTLLDQPAEKEQKPLTLIL
jgi:hypothetical protein